MARQNNTADAEVKQPETPTVETPIVETPVVSEKTQAEILAEKLSGIDYKNFKGDSFKTYQEIENGLLLNQSFDFNVYSAEPIMQARYPGLPGTPVDMVGILIKNDTPIHSTRIPVKFAKEMNNQLRNSGRYYLLKK